MTSRVKKKSENIDVIYIPTSPAELKIATEPDGIGAILPRTPASLSALLQRIKNTQLFDIEYSFALKKIENLKKLQGEIEKSISNGKPIQMSDYESLPLLRAKVGKFGVKLVESLFSA